MLFLLLFLALLLVLGGVYVSKFLFVGLLVLLVLFVVERR